MTKNFYEQARFNLFVENPQGFAELISETLLWWRNGPAPSESVLTTRLETIIGQFDLDPLRVCDVLLDVFIANEPQPGDPGWEMLGVLRLFSKANLLVLIEYRLHWINGLEEDRPEVARRLLGFCLRLIRLGLAEIEDVWPMLSPHDEHEIFAGFLRKEQLAFEYFENNFVVMIKHDERKKEQNLKRKKLLEDFFETERLTLKTRNWGKLAMTELFFAEDFIEGVDWVLLRWADGSKVDWTVSQSLFQAFLGFLQRQLAKAVQR